MMKQPIVPLEMPKMIGNTSSNEPKMSSCFVVKWEQLSSAFSHHLMPLNEMKF